LQALAKRIEWGRTTLRCLAYSLKVCRDRVDIPTRILYLLIDLLQGSAYSIEIIGYLLPSLGSNSKPKFACRQILRTLEEKEKKN
jgi:hypothetical protein